MLNEHLSPLMQWKVRLNMKTESVETGLPHLQPGIRKAMNQSLQRQHKTA